MFFCLDQTGPASAQVKWHKEVKCFVKMAGEYERRQAGLGHLDAQFLVQFADQALLRRLARLHLATGKFPKARQRLALRPLADQHPSVGVDEGAGRDQERLMRHGSATCPC